MFHIIDPVCDERGVSRIGPSAADVPAATNVGDFQKAEYCAHVHIFYFRKRLVAGAKRQQAAIESRSFMRKSPAGSNPRRRNSLQKDSTVPLHPLETTVHSSWQNGSTQDGTFGL
jgi:hypothetical protein